MIYILNSSIQKHFANFDKVMNTHGEIFRELEGRRTQRIELNGEGYFLKQHFGVGWKEIFKNLSQLKQPILSAKNEWQAIEKLHDLNIPTMSLMGYGRRGLNPAKQQSFLLTQELKNVISLEDLIKEKISYSQKTSLIKEVARIARILHQNGINHRDFYICHFLLNKKTQTLYLIDLHRAQIRKTTPLRWLVKDLAGLYFSSKDMALSSRDLLRFVREYRQQPLRNDTREGHFWQRITKRGDKLYRKHAK